MKDLSFFLLKNSLGAKMRKGIRTFCSGDGSTSTLNQHKTGHGDPPCILIPSPVHSPCNFHTTKPAETKPTLEEMILQLEFEEEIARKAKLNDHYGEMRGRMSCVNNSDILRSARNALNQYPRFSLDGKDAMYRSSFRNADGVEKTGRKSVCCDRGLRKRFYGGDFDSNLEKTMRFPPTLAGESVVWCKPGVVAKLMGLEAMPVPVSSNNGKEKLSSVIKRQSLRRRAERHEMERRLAVDLYNCDNYKKGRTGSCSKTGYCVMKPVAVEPADGGTGWPTQRFL